MGLDVEDFVCNECRLVIELDGEQHLGSAADVRRDAWSRPRGFYVLWFWDREVLLALEGVRHYIRLFVERASVASPFPKVIVGGVGGDAPMLSSPACGRRAWERQRAL